MALIDDRGRLFGRLNIIDAAAALLLLGIIPLTIAAYLLFRQPEPSIESIEPTKITPSVTRVQIKGRNLRPFLRISFNQEQGRTFALIDAETVEVQIPSLPPGTYDVILYDVAREISRLPAAVVVEGPAVVLSTEARMIVAGRFVGLDAATAAELQPKTRLAAVGGQQMEILARGEPIGDRRWLTFSDHLVETSMTDGHQLPALVRTTCIVVERRCRVGGMDIENAFVLPVFHPQGRPMRFVVSEAVADGPTELLDVHTRFVLPEESSGQVRVGDRARRDPLLGDRVPALLAVGAMRPSTAAVGLRAPLGSASAGEWGIETTDRAIVFDATVRVRVDVTTEGLQYRGRPIRAGGPFVFEHERYVLRGWVRSVAKVAIGNEGQQ